MSEGVNDTPPTPSYPLNSDTPPLHPTHSPKPFEHSQKLTVLSDLTYHNKGNVSIRNFTIRNYKTSHGKAI